MYCRFCGKENEAYNAFCVHCGNKVEQEETTIILEKESDIDEVPEEGVVTETTVEESIAQPQSAISLLKEEFPKEILNEVEDESQDNVAIPEEVETVVSVEVAAVIESDNTETVSKKKGKSKAKIAAIFLGIVVAGVGIGAGAFYFIQNTSKQETKSYEENYDPHTVFGMNLTHWEDGNYAEVYSHKIGEEKQQIDTEMNVDTLITSPMGGLIYFNKAGELIYSEVDKQPKVISNTAIDYNYYFENTGRFLIFSEKSESGIGDTYIYDTKKDTKEFLTEGMISPVGISYDEATGDFYYIDKEDRFYRLEADGQKNRIATNVAGYKLLDSGYYLIITGKYENYEYYLYRETETGIDKEQLDYDQISWSVGYFKDSCALLFKVEEYGPYEEGDIYIKLPNQKEVCIAKNVGKCTYGEDANKAYYLDEADRLYSIDLSIINKKALSDEEYFKNLMAENKAVKLLEDVESYTVSPNGKLAVGINSNNELFLLNEGERTKLATDVEWASVYNEHVYYKTLNSEFFIQDNIHGNKQSTLSEPVLLTSQLGEDLDISKYGRYVTYLAEKESNDSSVVSLIYYDRKAGSQILLEDINAYDGIVINKLEHVKTLTHEELEGYYACDELEILVQLEADGLFTTYMDGEMLGSVYAEYDPTGRYSMDVDLSGDYDLEQFFGTYMEVTKLADNSLRIFREGYLYNLEPVSKDIFEEKFNEQVRLAEEREAAQAEQRRREQLEATARDYYSYGAYIPANTYVYRTHDYSTATTLYTNNAQTWSIANYYIDYDSSVIWVEISYNYQGSSDYGWLPITQY